MPPVKNMRAVRPASRPYAFRFIAPSSSATHRIAEMVAPPALAAAARAIGSAAMDPPPWEQRFRAPVSTLPDWSPQARDRVVYASNESGVWQVHAWDLASGTRRRVTDHPVGVVDGMPTLDGEGVIWFQDETGDESGRWFVEPFSGGDARPFLEGVPRGWGNGLAQATGI